MSFVALASLLLLATGESFDFVPPSLAVHEVPAFSTEDLLSGRRDDAFSNVLVTTGLLAVRVPVEIVDGNGDGNSILSAKELLSGLCDCREKIRQIPDAKSTLLLDGKTTRSTIATATFGNDAPLSLPTRDIESNCARGQTKKLNEARHQVTRATDVFVPALDRLLLSWGSQTILPVKRGEDYKTVSSVIEDAKHLEHFHVYSKNRVQGSELGENEPESGVIDSALDWHTDAGLFLAFLPAVSCTDLDKPDNSFRIKISTVDKNTGLEKGREMRVNFPDERDGEIIVALMLGAGAENWLQTPTGLQLSAARHAVKMSSGEERVWYGKMYLVPEEAIIEQIPELRTFREMKKSVTTRQHGNMSNGRDHRDAAIGCGNFHSLIPLSTSPFVNNYSYYDIPSTIHSDRLLTAAGDCTGSELFCWMGCRETADNGISLNENVKAGNAIYCLDPEVFSDTGSLDMAVEACTTKIVGDLHNKNCTNRWKPGEEGVPTYSNGAFQKSWGMLTTIFASILIMGIVIAF